MTAIRIAAVIAAAAVSLAVPAAASAQEVGEISTSVAWNDLDVTTPTGAAQLDQRINTAARRACRGVRATGTNMSQTAFCRAQIKQSVLNRMDETTREAYGRASAEARASARADRV